MAGGEARAFGAQDGANAPQNQWAAVAAAHQMALKKPLSFIIVLLTGIEPVSKASEAFTLSVELQEQIVRLSAES